MTGTDGYGCSWRFYQSDAGAQTAREELASLELYGKAALADAMSAYGRGTAYPRNVKHLGDGIYEIRVNVGNNHFRTLFFHPMRFIAVALVVFYKNSNKTPKPMIDLAKSRRRLHLAR